MGHINQLCVVDKCKVVGKYVHKTTTTEMKSPTTSLLSDSISLPKPTTILSITSSHLKSGQNNMKPFVHEKGSYCAL